MEDEEFALAKQEAALAENLRGSPLEAIAEGIGALVSAAPWLGGPVSAVVTGRVTDRKLKRVNDALLYLSERVRGVEDAFDEDAVKSEEFEELLDATLPRISRERHEEKRKLYALYLRGALFHAHVPYEEKQRFLEILDQLQPAHVEVLRAYLGRPDSSRHGMPGSQLQTLKRRLPDYDEALIQDLVARLDDLRLVQGAPLRGMMSGADDLRGHVTAAGRRFLEFLLAD